MIDKKNIFILNSMLLITLSILLFAPRPIIGFIALVCSIILIKKQHNDTKKAKEEMDSYLETFTMTMDYKTKQSISNLHTPLCMVNPQGTIVWYNKTLSELFDKKGLFGEKIDNFIPNFNISEMFKNGKGEIVVDTFLYKTFKAIYNLGSSSDSKENNLMICFEDISEEVKLKSELNDSKISIISLQVDSLSEVLDSTDEKNKINITSDIEKTIKEWAEKFDIAVKKISQDKYFAILTSQTLSTLREDKFSILDDIRAINYENTIPISISMGISPFQNTLRDTKLLSEAALDIALARGGDQVAIKMDDKYVFYGGTLKAVEKKTRVKARIIGFALKDLIKESSNVLVMGHKNADLDAIGSALGIVAMAEMLEVDAKVILNESNSSIDALYKRIINNQKYNSVFVNNTEANNLFNSNTLVVVVDTHKTSLTEYPDIIKKSDRIVVIDHHRRGEEFIENPVLVYHETYASSASEMVTELMQYIKERPNINPLISDALLAGITLDTKNFTFKTGVRTFEAAAFLRKFGADTVEVKTLFQGDMETFLIKAEAMKNVEIISDSIAIAYYDKEISNPQLIASKIADELLNFKGIQASFVITKYLDYIQISARSLGKINVQIIMENLGGGGHIETAATQLQAVDIKDSKIKLKEEIIKYLQEAK